MTKRRQRSVPGRAEREVLYRVRTAADRSEHLTPRQHELHRPAHLARRQGREDHV